MYTKSLAVLLKIGIDVSCSIGSLAERIWDSSIYGSGVAIICRPAKSGAKRDDVEPILSKVWIDI